MVGLSVNAGLVRNSVIGVCVPVGQVRDSCVGA